MRRSRAQPLDGTSHVVNGQLAKAGEVDIFRVALKRGQSLTAALDAQRPLGSPMDGVLQILTSDGFVLVECDDEVDLDPRLNFVAPSDGNYLVRIFAFPAVGTSNIGLAGGADYIYRLTLTTAGFLDHVLPLALPAGQSTDRHVARVEHSRRRQDAADSRPLPARTQSKSFIHTLSWFDNRVGRIASCFDRAGTQRPRSAAGDSSSSHPHRSNGKSQG